RARQPLHRRHEHLPEYRSRQSGSDRDGELAPRRRSPARPHGGARCRLVGGRGVRPRVLILGGGFAGVGAAQKLEKADAEVVLVDRHDYHTFQPLLYQLATGLLDTTAVGHSLRDLLSRHENTTIRKARVTGIDLAQRTVEFDEIAPIVYDY